MEEIWIDIQGYEGKYQISSLGRIKCIYKGKNYLRVTTPNSRKYHCIILSKDRKQRGYLVHRLVAIHFIDNPNGKEYVNHKSFDKNDNSVSNLEWCTHQENINHAKLAGKYIDTWNHKNRSKKTKCYSITEDQVREIRYKYSKGDRICNLSKEYSLSNSAIGQIVRNKSWKYLL